MRKNNYVINNKLIRLIKIDFKQINNAWYNKIFGKV